MVLATVNTSKIHSPKSLIRASVGGWVGGRVVFASA